MPNNPSRSEFDEWYDAGGANRGVAAFCPPIEYADEAMDAVSVAAEILSAFINYCNFTDAIHDGVELTAAESAIYQLSERRLANPYAALAVNAAQVVLHAHWVEMTTGQR